MGLSKQTNSYQSSPTFHSLESTTALFASRHKYSVPCDLIVLRAYWGKLEASFERLGAILEY